VDYHSPPTVPIIVSGHFISKPFPALCLNYDREERGWATFIFLGHERFAGVEEIR